MMPTGTRLVMPTATKLILTGLAFVAAMGPAPARGAEAPEASMDFTTPAVRLNALAPLVVQADPADDLYRSARRAINNSEFRDAAEMFSRLRRDHRNSVYVGDTYYWEAFALFRTGGNDRMERALELLATQAEDFANASTTPDAPSLRVQIEGALAQRGDPEAGRRVAQRASQSCESEDQELRTMALSALLHMRADRAVPILREVLEDRDECSVELRRQAVFLVSQHMTDETVDILLDLAHRNPDPDREIRVQAVFWLSQVSSPEAIDALEDILRTSDDPELQERALFSLSQQSGARSTGILAEYAGRTDVPQELRENAIFWLGQSPGGGEYLIELYSTADTDALKEKIIFGVSQSGTGADGDWLLERALDESESIAIRKNALFWSGQIGMDVSRLAGLYLSVGDREMKEQVIFALSQSPDEGEAADQLVEIARSEEDADLKRNAIFWLGQIDDPRAAEFLLELIRGGAR